MMCNVVKIVINVSAVMVYIIKNLIWTLVLKSYLEVEEERESSTKKRVVQEIRGNGCRRGRGEIISQEIERKRKNYSVWKEIKGKYKITTH